MNRTTYCNPLDLNYRYQHMKENVPAAHREGADPIMVLFKGRYYLFVSMSAGFWHSADLLHWEFHAAPDLLIYDYAPDVRQIGDYLYFCASRRTRNCPILRTSDPLNEAFTEVSAPFPFWDPNLFGDDDGRVYLYWGCSNTEPIYGIELHPETMMPLGEKIPLIHENADKLGYERPGENGVAEPENSVMYQNLHRFYDEESHSLHIPPQLLASMGSLTPEALTKMYNAIGKPYIEGVYMTKYKGRYYLQYASAGTQYNTYTDAVYVGDTPLGPFTLQASNPFSAVPGGFAQGAGHGSTIADNYGNYWHTSTMRVSVNHDFERRVGLFPAGFDQDGVLFCNQNFADYPVHIPTGRFDPQAVKPQWMLLSYHKPATASSTAPGSAPGLAVNECIRNWWSAADAAPGQWICVDLEREYDVRAVQINFADEGVVVDFPLESYGDDRHSRHIELDPQITHYTLEISIDGNHWQLLADEARECANAYHEFTEGVKARYVRVTGGTLPYGQAMRVSGLRVFGNGNGEPPAPALAEASRLNGLEALIRWQPLPDAQGCNVRYGTMPDKLYLSWLVYDTNEVRLTTLIDGQDYYICVDSFNENGITPGEVFCLPCHPERRQ